MPHSREVAGLSLNPGHSEHLTSQLIAGKESHGASCLPASLCQFPAQPPSGLGFLAEYHPQWGARHWEGV